MLETIRAFFRSVGREMSENNAQQAWFPEGSEVLPNPIGTAPGFLLEQGRALFFCMPGVPRELERMLREQVLPRIAARRGGGPVVRATLLRTFGMGESSLDDELKDIAASGDVVLGFRTAFPDNYLRPVARAATAALADAKLAEVCAAIRRRLGALVYGEGEETMQAVVVRLLREQRQHARRGGVLHRRSAGLAAHGGAGRVGGLPGRRRGLRERGEDASCWASPRRCSPSTERCRTPPRARWRRGRGRASAPTSPSPSRASRARTGARRRSPWARVHVALARAEGTTAAGFVFPLDRTRHRQLSARLALDWVRRALLGEELVGPTLMRGRAGAPPPKPAPPK